MCVSKAWRRLISVSCCSPIFAGLLHKNEHRNKRRPGDDQVYFMPHKHLSSGFNLDFFGLSSKGQGRELQDSCNGLLLLCRNHTFTTDNVEKPGAFYEYYVVNPLTKQYVVIPKPKPTSGAYKYAALAYHPDESSHFKIVRFLVRNLDIYSSDIGKWSCSKIELSNAVIRARWVKQSLYFAGAIYRLSMSGHVLRFSVNNKTILAQEIEIQVTAKINEATCIGLSNGQIKLGIINGLGLRIWELNHHDSWSLKFSCPSHNISTGFITAMLRFCTYDFQVSLLYWKNY